MTTARGHDLSDHPQFAKGDFFNVMSSTSETIVNLLEKKKGSKRKHSLKIHHEGVALYRFWLWQISIYGNSESLN